MESEEYSKQSDITIATIRSTAKRNSAMRILIYLNNNSDPYTLTEIADELDMDYGTATNNLFKLTESGFIEKVEDRMDGRTKYFKISDKKATEKAIEYYEDRQRKLKKKEEEEIRNPTVESEKPREVEEIG
jgi:DNA-binding MarR family transcriptional regulator